MSRLTWLVPAERVRLREGQWDATISVMGDCEASQAVELIRALRNQLRQMTHRLVWVERQDVTLTNGRACALRSEAAALRRDIAEAQLHIDRLQRRYLNANKQNEQRRAR